MDFGPLYSTEGIIKALGWFWMYTVLSVVLWLTFLLRSQGSALYLSYQQQSDTLSMLLSNDIVGNKSWVNSEVKGIFWTQVQADTKMNTGCFAIGLNQTLRGKCWIKLSENVSRQASLPLFSLCFTSIWGTGLVFPVWHAESVCWIDQKHYLWPNKCIYTLSTEILLEALGSANSLILSVTVSYWQTDRCIQPCMRKSLPSLVKLAQLKVVKVKFSEF